MLEFYIATFVCGVVGMLTSIIGTSACFYGLYTSSRNSFSALEQKVKFLKLLVEDIQQKLNAGDVFRPDPKDWIKDAKIFVDQYDKLDLGSVLHEGCMTVAVCHQCRTWKSIEKNTKDVDKLRNIGDEFKVIGTKKFTKIDYPGKDFGDIKEKIWKEFLQERGVQIVCIHGIAGVGKTVMASVIHDEVLENITDYERVIWVSVEHKSVIKNIQEDIAGQLPVDLSACSDDIRRAEKLKAALTSKKFFMVLDYLPMWSDFSLDQIGIPCSGDNWKLIVVSRSISACRKVRGSFKDRSRTYEVKPLCQVLDEDWKLFARDAGINLRRLKKNTNTDTKRAVKDLDGLPSAIKMLAKALAEIPDDDHTRINDAWNRELLALSGSGSLTGIKTQEFFNGFEDTFERLGEDAFSCLVYCLLFPKGYIFKEKELIEYWMWEGLLGEVSSLEKTMWGGWEILYKLIDAHLLESIEIPEDRPEKSIRMLNVIRLVAMNAALKKDQELFINCEKSLAQLPLAKDWPPNTKRASFIRNEVCALQSNPDCKNLSTLLLQKNPLDKISHNKFFSKMINLRVLDLSDTRISYLPRSVSGLENLRALLLRKCNKLTCLPSLSSLQKLLVLDLSGTSIRELPKGLNNLTDLRRLDLSQTELEVLRAEEVGQLTKLEELLLMSNCEGKLKWGSSTINPDWNGLCIEELINLGNLVVLQLNFSDTTVFREFLRTSKFEQNNRRGISKRSFKFCVGKRYNNRNHSIGDNSLTVIRDHSATLPEGTTELHWLRCAQKLPSLNIDGCFKNLAILDVSDFDELEYVLTREILNSLTKLKEIRVKRCKKTVSIIKPDANATHPEINMSELTTLVFSELPELKSICDCQVLNCPSLRGLEVSNCASLELPEVFMVGQHDVEIKGDKFWLEKARQKLNQCSCSTFIFNQTPLPGSSLEVPTQALSTENALSSNQLCTSEQLQNSTTTGLVETTASLVTHHAVKLYESVSREWHSLIRGTEHVEIRSKHRRSSSDGGTPRHAQKLDLY